MDSQKPPPLVLPPTAILPAIAVPPAKSSLDSRSKLPYMSIPDGDLFNAVEKGFVSFWRLERTMREPGI